MYPTRDTTEVSIGEYLDVLKRRWMWVVFTPLILVGFTVFNDLRAEPVYSAQAELLLQSKQTEGLVGGVTQADPARAVQNELRVINSRTVKLAVEEEFGSPVAVSALAGGEDDIIIISAKSNSGKDAADRVNTYATTYQAVRINALLDDITSTKTIVQQQINDFQDQINEINAPLVLLDKEIASLSPDDPTYSAKVDNRQRVRETNEAARNEAQNQLTEYQQRLQVLDLSERLITTGGIQILNPASAPSTPISPTPVRNAIQALIVGLFVGIALAFVRDQLDDSLRNKADLERAVKDLPTLGLIPLDAGAKDAKAHRLTTLVAPMSATAEAYRGLRTSIQYAGLERKLDIIQVTSASAGEGKTTMLSNLAVAFAQAGKSVVVVGCDLRKPRLHQLMQVDGTKGFTSVVLGDLTLEQAVQTSPLHPNIDVLASGPLPPNPSELLSHDRTTRIIRALAEQYSMVFVDCPPVLPVTDALVLSRCVDATLVLAQASRTTRRTARRAVEMLRQVGSPLLGTVLVGVAGEDTYGSLYEYYGYASKPSVPVIGRIFGRNSETMPLTTQDLLPQENESDAARDEGPRDEPAEP